ncbi:MAG TPA: FAD-dependent monooxygenase [Chloroflexia bacterium]|nr:FAD-dependent monooxygenase [Chloroflexia bacterium]
MPSGRLKSKIVILGGGPAGLYCGLLIKRADPSCDVTVIERNPADVTYGWGVVFSDRTLASFQRADYKSYQQIADDFVIWDAIDVRYRGETVRCGGHVIAAISRKRLLEILQARCAELGVEMRFSSDVQDVEKLPEFDLLVAADGINSLVRRTYEERFKPRIEQGRAKYIWLGANKILDAFNFMFHETEHGLFQVHAYPYSGTMSTFIVECEEQAWLSAGLDKASEAESLAFCQGLLNSDLKGAQLLSNNSKWINFATLTTQKWSHKIVGDSESERHVVLLGDAAHTAHFSIGSGTKLAMEDAIALAGAIEQHADVATALNEYELERKPVVETFQRAAHESQIYFETIKRYLGLEPVQFAFQLLTRSGRISYADLHLKDARFGDAVDRWFCKSGARGQGSGVSDERGRIGGTGGPLVAPAPLFTPIMLRSLVLTNRVILSRLTAESKTPNSALNTQHSALVEGVGLVMTDICAVSPEGRIAPDSEGMYSTEHMEMWARTVEAVHEQCGHIGIQLGHAGRRGAVRPRNEGLDRPLRSGGWPLMAASPIPYTPRSQSPKEMDRGDMDRVKGSFVRAAEIANNAGFDLLQLHMAHGYLLAGFLSPLTNVRQDEYGGPELESRARFPLEVFGVVRAAWPEDKPVSVALNACDYARGGFEVEDAVRVARLLKEHGCDLIEVLAGQTTLQSEPVFGRGFLTSLSDRIRNEAGIPTMVGGYLTTSNEVNTVLAAGRADLCIMDAPHPRAEMAT